MNRIKEKLLDPKFAQKVHIIMAIFFFLNIPLAVTILANSVPYLVGLSVWALIAAHWAAFQGVHSELKAQEDNDVDFDQLGAEVKDISNKVNIILDRLDGPNPSNEKCL